MATPLQALRKAFSLIEDHMYCSGVVPLESNSSRLFYQIKDGSCASIDFLNTDDDQLAVLSNACEPASFGRDQEDVLDEEYRKAGKMDSSKFSSQFSIYASGVLNAVVSSLLKEGQQTHGIRAELYKLNVYGPGSFFKPHVDTPRSDAMFGSLVLVFPTKHEGGSLRFRQGDQRWSFESSDLVTSETCVAFTAFFSDVEHEVLPVTSGYRVTLTYNLYWGAKRDDNSAPTTQEHGFKEQARALLASTLSNLSYLPNGGLMGFGLTHMYPIDPKSTNLSEVRLKGSDAIMKNICEELGLTTGIRALYHGRARSRWSDNSKPIERRVLMEKFAKLGPGEVDLEDSEDGYVGYLYQWESAVKVLDTQEAVESHSDDERYMKKFKRRVARVDWVKPLARVNNFQSTFIAYGNEARAAIAYGEICLVAEVAPAAERASAFKEQETADVPATGNNIDGAPSPSGTTPTSALSKADTESNPIEPSAQLKASLDPSQPTCEPGSVANKDSPNSEATTARTAVDAAAASTPAEPATQQETRGKKGKQVVAPTQPTRMSLRTRKAPH